MGRGLSPLQKKILGLAFENRIRIDRMDESIKKGEDVARYDLFTFEIYRHLWSDFIKQADQRVPADDAEWLRWRSSKRGVWNYDPWLKKLVGPPKYAADHVSVSRAISRLFRRDLIKIVDGTGMRWMAINLTETGKQVAVYSKSLSR